MQKKLCSYVRIERSICKETTQGNSSRPAFSPPAILFNCAGGSLASPQLHSLLVFPPDKDVSNSFCRKYFLENGDDDDGGGDGDDEPL